MATGRSSGGPGAVMRRRDAALVLQPTTLLRSLGNAGAVANVRAVLDARRREEWVLDSLLRRLEAAPLPVAPAVAVARHTRVA